jgi:hypothetical protein
MNFFCNSKNRPKKGMPDIFSGVISHFMEAIAGAIHIVVARIQRIGVVNHERPRQRLPMQPIR